MQGRGVCGSGEWSGEYGDGISNSATNTLSNSLKRHFEIVYKLNNCVMVIFLIESHNIP